MNKHVELFYNLQISTIPVYLRQTNKWQKPKFYYFIRTIKISLNYLSKIALYVIVYYLHLLCVKLMTVTMYQIVFF